MPSKYDLILTELATIKEQGKNMAKDTENIPIMMEKLNRLNQTVYGENGNNGLNSDVKLLKKAFIGAQAIIVLGGSALMMFKDEVLSFLTRK